MKAGSLFGVVMLIVLAGALPAQTVPAASARSSGVITVGGTPHPYLTEGTGLPCIVIGLAPAYPPQLSERAKQHIRFIFVDFKNSWGAEAPRDVENITMDTLVDEVDEVRRALGLDKVCVFGHSTPAFVAIEYLLRHPGRVSHAIIVNAPPSYRGLPKLQASFWEADASADRKAVLRRNVERMPDTVLRSLSARDAFAIRYVRNGPRYFYEPSYDLYWAWAGLNFSAELLNRYFNMIVNDYDPRQRLLSNTVPIFVAQGRYDYAVPYELWNEIKDKIPRLRYELFERSAHFTTIEEPALFDDKLIHWLNTTK